ncbi:hypothetical protein CMQ_4537 [Grosmannia clavigera kw1407]|uniref:Uncharacterized protein n=1 Tax=Grosmannia clavigera (strain kw1407 / UAMH 11150) TaxID=655863 RepID=F0XUM4_GROCL|nr:uncharacterized protein CMQ_4537 [Grosmannia clavigera kw1407]EFW98685.1 hypothetical protein CMQ_4537 [Grosmannia clavigera kw1407]
MRAIPSVFLCAAIPSASRFQLGPLGPTGAHWSDWSPLGGPLGPAVALPIHSLDMSHRLVLHGTRRTSTKARRAASLASARGMPPAPGCQSQSQTSRLGRGLSPPDDGLICVLSVAAAALGWLSWKPDLQRPPRITYIATLVLGR